MTVAWLLEAAEILPEIEAGREDAPLGFRTCSVGSSAADMTQIQFEMMDTCPQMFMHLG